VNPHQARWHQLGAQAVAVQVGVYIRRQIWMRVVGRSSNLGRGSGLAHVCWRYLCVVILSKHFLTTTKLSKLKLLLDEQSRTVYIACPLFLALSQAWNSPKKATRFTKSRACMLYATGLFNDRYKYEDTATPCLKHLMRLSTYPMQE
jgi:hypothetical protein